MALLDWIVATLAGLTAEPDALALERPKAEAAVAAAAASLAPDKPSPTPEPAPAPTPATCTKCNGRGYIVHGDGHRTVCPCQTAKPPCPDGRCPTK